MEGNISNITPSREGMTTKPVLVIAAFFIVVILLASINELAGGTAIVMKSALIDIQADRVVSAGIALDSNCAGGEMGFDMSGYELKFDEDDGIVVRHGDDTVSESARPLIHGYDVIEAPESFEPIQNNLVLRKEFKDGDEVLVIDTSGYED